MQITNFRNLILWKCCIKPMTYPGISWEKAYWLTEIHISEKMMNWRSCDVPSNMQILMNPTSLLIGTPEQHDLQLRCTCDLSS